MLPSTACHKPPTGLLPDIVLAASLAAIAGLPNAACAAGPSIAPATVANSGLTVSLYIDPKKNDQFKNADPVAGAYVYALKPTAQGAAIRLDNKDILALWKGNGVIASSVNGQESSGYFENASQFAPVFLVLSIANKSQRAAQISRAFLDIAASRTDLQPYVDTWPRIPICMGGFDPKFSLINYGWGVARDGRLSFALGNQSRPKTRTLTIDIGDLAGLRNFSVGDSLKALGIDIDKLANGKFECPSQDKADQCLAHWRRSRLLAPLKGALFSKETRLFTRLRGELTYRWTDMVGAVHTRTTPMVFDVPLLNVGYGAHCSVAGPVERDFAAFELPLDRTNVRIPLKLSDWLAPRQTKRYGINLSAGKSSHHRFRFVFELTNGTTAASPTVDLDYFKPQSRWTN